MKLVSKALRLLLVMLVASTAWTTYAQSTEPIETIRVESDLVNLKVSVVSRMSESPTPVLEQKDFMILEDGKPQEISFFAAADAPFDLVLLLDLSGSTVDKINLIRRSAKRFVDATRPMDRVAVITFTDSIQVVSGFTRDRGQLKSAIDAIQKPTGGTNFWDAMRFVFERVLSQTESSHRSAVVVMTDGVDNALPDVNGEGSRTTFEELLQMVSHSDALIFPVYLDTEKETVKSHRSPRLAYVFARDQLNQLAAACGTRMYWASKLKDLDEVYGEVIKDLGTVYSIGYKPPNAQRDGKWHTVTVKLVDREDLAPRTKSGYFAKSDAQSLKD